MFIIKNNYYLYIENTNDVNLNLIKKNRKIFFIYRNNNINENLEKLKKFRKKCHEKGFKFYVSNNLELFKKCKADGLYVSSFNKKFYQKNQLNLIGSAHNFREINQKMKQGCKTIFLSRLFRTSYKKKRSYLGLVKFNLIARKYMLNIVPLGGIRSANLNRLNIIYSNGLALLSEIKKKPVITNRLF
jgi:thiamine monophosphate synthase